MNEICNNCIFLETTDKETSSKERYWCKKNGGYHSPTERACGDFSYSRSSGSSNQGGFKPSGFSWITPLLNKFGNIFCADCGVTNNLANFSMLFADLNPEYDEALEKACQEEEFKKEDNGFFVSLATNFLLPWANAINLQKFDEAMAAFKNMIDSLLQKLGISLNLNNNLEKGKSLKLVNPNLIIEGA